MSTHARRLSKIFSSRARLRKPPSWRASVRMFFKEGPLGLTKGVSYDDKIPSKRERAFTALGSVRFIEDS